jgi:hypothetical protein
MQGERVSLPVAISRRLSAGISLHAGTTSTPEKPGKKRPFSSNTVSAGEIAHLETFKFHCSIPILF